jgi:hypothetical protein
MNLSDISNIRLIRQQIAGTKFKTVKEIVCWMGAMQGQDYTMAKWAIGTRLPGSTEKTVEAAINRGEIIRTHLLRPTWHFVSAEDIYWMLELTAPHIKASLKFRSKWLGLTDTICKKSNKIIEKALIAEKHLTRDEIVKKLENAKINTEEQRAHHLLLRAELDGIICSGRIKLKKQTYALLEERIPKSKTLNRDEALEKLARKYFTSHCPATLKDFVWWSGLPVNGAKRALEMVKQDLISEKISSQVYWLINSFSIPKNYKESIYLLPAYDEFLISYKDRNAAITFENNKKAISNNGIFRPTIIINGQVKGIWKQLMKKNKVIIETDFFQPPGKATINSLKKQAFTLGVFLGKNIELINTPKN